jgi:tetratricopeptide (TPR) repeat protein
VGSFGKNNMKIRILAAISLCLLILCSQCLAEDTDYFDWKGLKSYAAKNYTDSIAYFDIAIRQDPTYIDAWLHKGDAQMAMKDYNASIAAAKTTELDNNKANWLREGNLLQTQELYPEAITKFEGALTVDPAYKDALYKKGFMLMALNNLTDAEKQFDEALQIDPNFKQAYVAKGVILEADGKYLEAKQAYDKALEIDPAYAQALAYKMHVLLILKKQEEAMKIFVKI